MITYLHCSECTKCKIRAQFYAEFNNDNKKNAPYFGIISYINYYIFMNVSSEESKKAGKTVCLIQLKKEWSSKKVVQNPIEGKKLIGQYFKEENEQQSTSFKKKAGTQKPLHSPEHKGNLITIKKSESFSESSLEDTIFSKSLKKPKNIYKRKLKKKRGLSTKKVAAKEPKLGTLKRRRFNWTKLKQNGVYEDDLFFETKLKCSRLSVNKELTEEKDPIKTPKWSLPVSPVEMSSTPNFEECLSPTEFQNVRKEAEEYQYRRNKRRKRMRTSKKVENSDIQMKKDTDTYKTLQSVRKILEEMKKKDSDGDSEEDDYFTDEECSNT